MSLLEDGIHYTVETHRRQMIISTLSVHNSIQKSKT